MRHLTLGFVGLGVVGGAVAKAFATKFPTIGYDLKTAPDTKEQLLETDMIFLSLPTYTVAGAQDQRALQETCQWLSEREYRGPVIVKSTVLPGTCAQLRKDFGLRIVHNPEFLTAKSPVEDFMNQPSVVLSGQEYDIEIVGNAYSALIPTASVVWSKDYAVTEIAKYTHNLFLATKVGFLNEIYKICAKMDVKYDAVMAAALSQEKIGATHTRIPNVEKETNDPNPKFGFGGVCFPKDLQALLTWAKENGLELMQMDATNEANLKIRPETCLK